ncbi:PRTRC system protein E [Pandoraea commovens]|uniref:PRTRC system protein E n=1 Tax=Pandoraea commovens TaxID=2508289 RepID=A0ABY5QIU1_9BURK|nr:PRTRC system protein E [Pandoraea commovens]UVA80445.1 PRTRC system protein E [Pandoraea commovens]
MFTELHALAQRTSLTIAVTAEGEHLRVHVLPTPTKEGTPVHPLSLIGTPEELDEQFPEAVAIYEPGALSLLDQARAAAHANAKGNDAETPAATNKPKSTRGQKRRGPTNDTPPTNESAQGAAPTDTNGEASGESAASSAATPNAPSDADDLLGNEALDLM